MKYSSFVMGGLITYALQLPMFYGIFEYLLPWERYKKKNWK